MSSGESYQQLQITFYGYDVSTSTLIQTPSCPCVPVFSPIVPLGQKISGNNRKVIIGSDTVTAVHNKPLSIAASFSISAHKKAITNIASK